MRKTRAPKHTLAHPMEFIPAGDSAWSQDIPGDATSDHPFWRYWRGETRFDLQDDDVTALLDADADPEVWRLRVLDYADRMTCQRLLGRGEPLAAYEHAFLRGVVGVTGASAELAEALEEKTPTKRQGKHIKAIKEAVERYAFDAVQDIGAAVIRSSGDLTVAEGKPSASPPGD